MQIYFLIDTPLTEQAKRDLLYHCFSEYSCTWLNIGPMTGRHYDVPSQLKSTIIHTYHDLKKILTSSETEILLVTNIQIFDNFEISKIITSTKRLKTLYVQKGDFLEATLLSSGSLKLLYRRLKYLLRKLYYYPKIFDFAVQTAKTPPTALAKTLLSTHHEKFESFNNSYDLVPLKTNKYAVYVDQNLPFHPDFLVHQGVSSVDPKNFFTLLNRFFDDIESNHGVEVVIALHPKSTYPNDVFGGRNMVLASTENLIKYSEFVMLHCSTSVASVVLHEKEVHFLIYPEMFTKATKIWARITQRLAAELRAPIINIATETVKRYDTQTTYYQRFKYKYLVSASRESENTAQTLRNKFASKHEKR